MDWISLTFAVIPVLLIKFIFSSDKPKLYGIYSQPGKWYYPKRWLFTLVLHIREWRAKKKYSLKDRRRDWGLGAGFRSQDLTEAMENVQPLVDHPQALDSIYFNGMDHNGTFFVMRIGRRHGRMSEIWLNIKHPKHGFLQSPVHPDTRIYNTDGRSFTAGGLAFQCLDPHRRWKITFNGLFRKGLCNVWPPKPDDMVHVKFNFIWEAYTDTFDFHVDPAPSTIAAAFAREKWTNEFWENVKLHQPHYEQWGELQGNLEVEGVTEHISLRGVRDHSFGIRDWYWFHRYVIIFGCLKDGTAFHVNNISLPKTLSYIQCGYLFLPCGIKYPVTWVDFDMPSVGEDGNYPNSLSLKFSAGGKTYELKTKTLVTAKYCHHEDWRSVVHECMSEFTVNGVPGSGIVEYIYRNEGGCPVPAEESVEPLCEKELSSLGPEDLQALTLSFTRPAGTCSGLVGGKGCQLALLTQYNTKEFSVQAGFSLTIAAFQKQLEKNPNITQKIQEVDAVSCKRKNFNKRKKGNLQAVCEETVKLFKATNVAAEVEAAVKLEVKAVFGEAFENKLFAVRSSAVGEDSDEMSAAGQMDTVLGVKGLPQILEAIKQCWASHFAFTAVEYRRQHGQPIVSSMGVVVQEMVTSETSGVMFTRDPLTSNPFIISINANYGLGESVVSGSAEPDTIVLSRSWDGKVKVKETVIGSKKIKITATGKGDTEESIVTSQEAQQCCLSEKEAIKLANVGIMLEKAFGGPRDIEWAYYKDCLYLLQARPITTVNQESMDDIVHEFDTPLASDKEILTVANIGEMMPGALCPLTLSIFIKGAENAFYSLAGVCEQHVIINDKRMLEVALLGENKNLLSKEEIIAHWGESSFLNKLRNAARYIWFSASSYKKTKAWEDKLQTFTFGEHQRALDLYQAIDDKLPDYVQVWIDTVANSGRSGAWSQILISILAGGKPEWKSEHYADVAMLLSTCEDVYSADVPAALHSMALDILQAKRNEEFTQMTVEDATKWIIISSDSGILQEKFQEFLKRHGHRCIREADFMEQSWQTRPEKVVTVLQAMLKNPESLTRTSKQTTSISEAVSQVKTPLTWFGRKMLTLVLPRARKAVGGREWGKSVSIVMVEKFKQAYWQLAGKMVSEGYLPDEELMFYLTHKEIGHLFLYRSGALIAKAQKRRKAHALQKALSFERLCVGHPQPIQQEDEEEEYVTSIKLKGMPVSQGVVKGTVRVATTIQDAANIKAGDILVVPYTDVGWSPYFPLISGLVTELGGLVSHGAVVAREYGLPCIVNVPKATKLLKSGDLVVLDGTKGTCEKVELSS